MDDITRFWVDVIIVALALQTVLFAIGAAAIFIKVRHNHLRYKVWRTLLLSLGILFVSLSFMDTVNLAHMVLHRINDIDPQHIWTFMPYVVACAALAVFVGVLFFKRRKIDTAIVNHAAMERAKGQEGTEEEGEHL